MPELPVQQIDLELIQQLGNLELIARYVVEGFITGLHKSPFHGFSVEFAEHRLYNPGESTRYIDWKLFARTDKLFIKKFEEETNLRCQILIDNSSSMYFPDSKYNKLQFSIYTAAALIKLMRMQRDAIGLTVFSDEIESFHQSKSNQAHVQMLYNILANHLKNDEKNKKTSTAKVLHHIAEAIHKRSLVIIFSDMFDNPGSSDEFFSGLQHLRYNKHEVILFHVTDHLKEMEFEYSNRPFQFIDMETGDKVNLFPSEIREHYIQNITEFKKQLRLKCDQYRIDYVDADINNGFYQVLQAYLIKRTKLY